MHSGTKLRLHSARRVRASRRSSYLYISLNHNRNSVTRVIEIRIVAPPADSYFPDLHCRYIGIGITNVQNHSRKARIDILI